VVACIADRERESACCTMHRAKLSCYMRSAGQPFHKAILTTGENTARWYTAARKRGIAAMPQQANLTSTLCSTGRKLTTKTCICRASRLGLGDAAANTAQPLDTLH